MTQMSEQEAALQLAGSQPDLVDPPVPPEPEMAAEEPEEESEERKPLGPPRRIFRWVDDSQLTVDNWLVGMATGDLEVFPGVVFRFCEAKSREMREADAVVNSMGPAFVMTGLLQPSGNRDDFMRSEQWARARNIAMLAISITHMGGEEWPPGKNLREKFDVLDDMGHVKLDRLIMAFSEYTAQLAYLVEATDLPNS